MKTLREIQRDNVLDVFAECGRNVRRTADVLDVNVRTLYELLGSYGIERPGKSRPTKERLVELLNLHRGKEGVGKALGVPHSRVRSWMIYHGLATVRIRRKANGKSASA